MDRSIADPALFIQNNTIGTFTILGNILIDNPQLRFVATFKYATLYAFHENYTTTPIIPTRIAPWNYNPETNYTLTIEPNATRFTATTNSGGRISLMYTFNQPVTIKEALWLTIKSHNQSRLVVVMFSNLQNRTTDFFYYQCQLTNQTRKPVINLKEGTTKGNFNPNHIEGMKYSDFVKDRKTIYAVIRALEIIGEVVLLYHK